MTYIGMKYNENSDTLLEFALLNFTHSVLVMWWNFWCYDLNGYRILNALHQRSPTDGPRENFGGPWRNLDIICNFYVYYTYFKQAATNITLIILLQLNKCISC
jgi:hypothetical protein